MLGRATVGTNSFIKNIMIEGSNSVIYAWTKGNTSGSVNNPFLRGDAGGIVGYGENETITNVLFKNGINIDGYMTGSSVNGAGSSENTRVGKGTITFENVYKLPALSFGQAGTDAAATLTPNGTGLFWERTEGSNKILAISDDENSVIWSMFNTGDVYKQGSRMATADPATGEVVLGTKVGAEVSFYNGDSEIASDTAPYVGTNGYNVKIKVNGGTADGNFLASGDRVNVNGNAIALGTQDKIIWADTANKQVVVTKDVDLRKTLTITPATVTANATNADGINVYNNASVTFNGLFNGDTVGVTGGATIADNTPYSTFTKAQDYVFTVGNNYTFGSSQTYTINVAAKNVVLNNGIVANGQTGTLVISERVDTIDVSATFDMYGIRYESFATNNNVAISNQKILNTQASATIAMSNELTEISLTGAIEKEFNIVVNNGTSSANKVVFGEKIVLTPAEQSGMVFVNWTVGGNIVSTLPNYSFRVTEDITITANFIEAEKAIYTHTFLDFSGYEYVVMKAATADMPADVKAPNVLGLSFYKWKVTEESAGTNDLVYVPVFVYNEQEVINVKVNNEDTLYNSAIVLEAGKTYLVNGAEVVADEDITIYAVSDLTIAEKTAEQTANEFAVSSRVDSNKANTIKYISVTVVASAEINEFAIDFDTQKLTVDSFVKNGNVYQFCVSISEELISKAFGETGAVVGQVVVDNTPLGGNIVLR